MSMRKRKISLELFQKYPRGTLGLVNRQDVEVIVYDENGAVARLIPYAAGPMGVVKESGVRPMDMGGVWYVDEALRRRLSRKRRGRRIAASLGSVWKLSRFSAILAFFTRV
ncbi:MAG: hypothetical protein ACNS63_10805 [Candidatus Nitrospinota bacterium M3_3B_026]